MTNGLLRAVAWLLSANANYAFLYLPEHNALRGPLRANIQVNSNDRLLQFCNLPNMRQVHCDTSTRKYYNTAIGVAFEPIFIVMCYNTMDELPAFCKAECAAPVMNVRDSRRMPCPSRARKRRRACCADMAASMWKVPKSIDRCIETAQVNVTFVNRSLLLSLVCGSRGERIPSINITHVHSEEACNQRGRPSVSCLLPTRTCHA